MSILGLPYFYFALFGSLFFSIQAERPEYKPYLAEGVQEAQLHCIESWVCDMDKAGTDYYVKLNVQFEDGTTCTTNVSYFKIFFILEPTQYDCVCLCVFIKIRLFLITRI